MGVHRVFYLIIRENIFRPGVMKSQVLDLIGEMTKSGEVKVTILNLPSLHNFLGNLKNYRPVRDLCRKRGIRLVVVPILPIGRSFMPAWAIPFFLVQAVPLVLFFSIKYRIDLIHARSYLSALAGYLVKRFLGVRLIFDTRSLYLAEARAYGGWRKSDSNYKLWERLERKLFAGADRTVVQASAIKEYVEKTAPSTSVSLIPSLIDEKPFRMLARDREGGRRKLGISGKFVFIYSGSLGRLHKPEFLASFYSLVCRSAPRPHFLVATQSNPEELLAHLKNLGVGGGEVTVSRNPDLGKVLPLGDAGLHVYGNSPIAPYASSVKMPEYSASGVPVVVTKNMTSVAELVERSGCGVVIDPLDKNDIRVKIQQLVKKRERMGKNALKLAKNYFSVEACAKKYLGIYDEIISKNNS